jgi:D-sedoheptulose 7-phosphate isomerase
MPANPIGRESGRLAKDGVPMSRPIDDLIRRLPDLECVRHHAEEAVAILEAAVRIDAKILVCGNGGSASDSEHLVADLMKGFMSPRPIPADDLSFLTRLYGDQGTEIGEALQGAVSAISLGSAGALTTAIGNDIRFDMVFAQQVYGLGRARDVLLAISTTGNSPSVVNAAVVAKLRSMRVIALTGRDGGELAALADLAIRVPADQVFEIQELHMPVYHAIALALEQAVFPEVDGAVAETVATELAPEPRVP